MATVALTSHFQNVMLYEVHAYLPLCCHHNSEEYGAIVNDVVDWVEKLWEEIGVHLTSVGNRPLEGWN